MSISGRRALRVARQGVALAGLLCLPACTDATLEATPGEIDVKIQLNATVPGSVNVLRVEYAGSWQAAPAGVTGALSGDDTASETRNLNQAQQVPLVEFPRKGNLKAGTWQFAITVSGDGTQIFSITCADPITINSSAVTTLTATQGGGCISQ
jgi:hypothetical protein